MKLASYIFASLCVLGDSVYAQQGIFNNVGISATTNNLWISGTVDVTNLSVSDTLYMAPTILPTCNLSTSGQTRRSVNKSCFCNGTQWQDIAPPAITLLGISVLSFGSCP